MAVTVRIDQIIIGPRRSVEKLPNRTITLLAENIKSVGRLKKPIIVRPKMDKYELVCGLKRLKACMFLSWTDIPVDIRELSDKEAEELSYIDNMHQM